MEPLQGVEPLRPRPDHVGCPVVALYEKSIQRTILMMGGRVEAIEDADPKNNLINMTAPGLPAHPSFLCNSPFRFHPPFFPS